MKKIIGAGLVIFTLASCGTQEIKDPNEVLKINQTQLVESIENIYNVSPEISKSTGDISIDIDSIDAKIEANIKYDSLSNKNTLESSNNFDITLEAEEKEESFNNIGELSSKLNIDLITLKEKIIFKLNSLELSTSEENQYIDIFKPIADSFKNNWYYIENTLDNNFEINQNDILLKQKEIISLAKNYQFLEYIKTNENKDYYDFDVKLSEENISAFINEINSNDSNIQEIKKDISQINDEINGNIKINKKDLNYFILNLNNEFIDITIENNKENFDINIINKEENISVDLKGKKYINKFEIEVIITEENQEIISANGIYKSDGNKTNIELNGKLKEYYSDEEVNFSFSINNNTQKADFNITIPSEMENFEEVISEIMMNLMYSQ